MANRLDQLTQLADQVPDLENQQRNKGKAARDALLARSLGDPGVANIQQAQNAQVQSQLSEGQQRVEQLKTAQKENTNLAQMAVQEKAQVGEANIQRQALSLEERQQSQRSLMAQRLQNESLESKKRVMQSDINSAQRLQEAGYEVDSSLQFATQKQRADLTRLGNGVREELLDSRIAFDKDEVGRKFSNTRQLADYAAASARDKQDFDAKMRSIAQAAKTEEILMSGLRDRLLTIQKQGFIDREGDMDRSLNIRLSQMAAEAQTRADKARAKTANKLAIGQALGTVAGAVIGGVVGTTILPGVGTAAGASGGAAIGGAAGTAISTAN